MNVKRAGSSGRPSSRERILDAAERVVEDLGASHMTMDAVAVRARVSKGGLIYHFPSQRALLQGMLQRFMKRVEARRMQALAETPAGPTRNLKAYLRSWLMMDEQDRRSAMALLATITREVELVEAARRRHREVWSECVAAAPAPERAMLLAMAVEGMWLSDLLGVSPLTPAERARFHAAILRFAEQWDSRSAAGARHAFPHTRSPTRGTRHAFKEIHKHE